MNAWSDPPPPQPKTQDKGREQLWKETLMGGVLFVFGLALIWQYTEHTKHGHAVDQPVLWVGVGTLSLGTWLINKKLSSEWMTELRKFIPFLKGDK